MSLGGSMDTQQIQGVQHLTEGLEYVKSYVNFGEGRARIPRYAPECDTE